jgi:hypothetical protein
LLNFNSWLMVRSSSVTDCACKSVSCQHSKCGRKQRKFRALCNHLLSQDRIGLFYTDELNTWLLSYFARERTSCWRSICH